MLKNLVCFCIFLFSVNLGAQGWVPEIKHAIDKLIEEHGKTSPNYNPKKPPVVTLDWDNTMTLNDIGEATFMYLVNNMGFSFNEDFWKLIPEKNLKKDVTALKKVSKKNLRSHKMFLNYRKKMLQSYWDLCEKKGDEVCYGWVAQIMTGLTTPDVKKATEATLDLELKQPIGKETIQLDEHDPKKLTVNQGIRYYPEMKELVLKFQNAGFDVWVVSASTQWIVEVAAKKVGVHANRVLGILLDVDKKQRLTSKILRLTYRKGKADAILKDIGKTPVFAAGDSNTDIEMLLLGSGPRLVIDRGKKPLMDIAKEKAWLIQPKFL